MMARLLLAIIIVLLSFSGVLGGINKRAIIIGDSIQSHVFEPGGEAVIPDVRYLTANLVPELANVAVTNISAPGQRMASGGYAGYGLESNLNLIWYAVGGGGVQTAIITLGTNDWVSPAVSGIGFITAYRQAVKFAQSQGLTVVCVPPLWRKDMWTWISKTDGWYSLADFQSFAANVCFEEGAKVFDANQIGLLPEHFADGLHLNQKGHEKFAGELIRKMKGWGYW